VISGRKVWISKAMEPEKILLLTRTARFEDSPRKTQRLTLFLTDLDRDHVDIRPTSRGTSGRPGC
jgi:acyl-CoA dehydrogenase